ncbi:fumarylacetoacetate hydrolase family protein [Dactylosporangium sp. CA-092794]|uniref:fumarylacetoacetate hydrolase family protein n=1 Tax=Dactylosporangium sp. CA-092794 TaxID=3239929 RepID=UPI003D91A83F
MRLGTVDGRAAILGDDRRCLDVARASDGRFPADPVALLERWDELRDWAATRAPGPGWGSYEDARLGAPVPRPRQVFALAVNYLDHAAEAAAAAPEAPYVFTKFPSCITGPFDDVVLPSDRADWEVELVVVIGRRAERVAEAEAWDHVAGLTVGQDISERRVQFRKPLPHLDLAKSFPTFGPIGPALVTLDEIPDRDDLPIRCAVNGERMQDATTASMVFPVARIVAHISRHVSLLPGDLIFTGTPAGVGSTRDPRRYLAPGDVITSEIAGLGLMRNTCRGQEIG